jgi:hypothetical protein
VIGLPIMSARARAAPAYERARQQRGLSMILGMSVGAFTILRVIITLVEVD